jgi:hypothetical protein
MASFWERVQNALDDNQKRQREEHERQQARQEGYQRALYDVRDALLVAALAVKSEWQNQLARDGDRVRSSTDVKYTAQLQGLNEAFTALRQMEPRITTRLHIEQLRDSAIDSAERMRHSESKISYGAASRNGHTRREPDMNQAEYQAGYQQMRERLDRNLASARSRVPIQFDSPQTADLERRLVHDLALAASRDVRDNWGDRGRGPERLDHPDYDRGQRKAIMDWSHQHNHRLAQVIQVLNQQSQQPNDDAPRLAQRIRM